MSRYEKALKSEDRTIEVQGINPSKVLESLGIDSYSIDWEQRRVYLVSTQDLKKLCKEFDKQCLDDNVSGIIAFGWRWLLYDNSN